MPKNKSQRIVDFLANLPHYQPDKVNGEYVAIRITDGTIFSVSQDETNQEEGFLEVCWGGDLTKKTIVRGTQVAGLAIVDAVNYWVAIGDMSDPGYQIQYLFKHFNFKTGASIPCQYDEDSPLTGLTKFLGKELAGEVIKKAIFP